MTLDPNDGEVYALARAILLAMAPQLAPGARLSDVADAAWALAEAFLAEAKKRSGPARTNCGMEDPRGLSLCTYPVGHPGGHGSDADGGYPSDARGYYVPPEKRQAEAEP